MGIRSFLNGSEISAKDVSVGGGRTRYLVQNGQTIYHESVDFVRGASSGGAIGNGSTPDGVVPIGEQVTVIAVPNSGQLFSGWFLVPYANPVAAQKISSNATDTFTVTRDWKGCSLRATFEVASKQVTLIVSPTVAPLKNKQYSKLWRPQIANLQGAIVTGGRGLYDSNYAYNQGYEVILGIREYVPVTMDISIEDVGGTWDTVWGDIFRIYFGYPPPPSTMQYGWTIPNTMVNYMSINNSLVNPTRLTLEPEKIPNNANLSIIGWVTECGPL